MFLNHLTPTQQTLFVELARVIAEQDGIVDTTEELLLEAVRAECGLEDLPAVRAADAVLADVASGFDSSTARNVVLLELAGVAIVDGDAHPAEVALVTDIARQLGLDESRVAESLAFAERSRQLVVDGQAFIASTGAVS